MPAPQGRLIGRDDQLASLVEALRAAQAGNPGTVIVSGEPGIGKTRLVEAAVDHARAEDFLIASGQCSPVRGTRLPYAPVVDLLADLLDQVPDLSHSVPEETWRGVAPLTGGEEHQSAADVNMASTRLFAGFVAVLSAVSRQRPVMQILEDVHWADPASVDLIAFAARKLRRDRIVLVLTNRPAGATQRSPMRSALGELRRLATTTDIGLGPLADSALQELLEELPIPPGPSHQTQIAAQSQGNPFFALHMALHDEGRSVPPRLRDVLLSSLDELSTDERELLILLTVMGDVHDDQLLVEAARTSVEAFNATARSLVDRGLLQVRDGSIGFRHALLRDVVVDDTLPSERVVAHAHAADALLASGAAERPGRAPQIAFHLLECGRHEDAIRYAVLGAQQAGRVWAFADARSLYAAARRLWPLIEAPESAAGITYADLLRESATASRWCGDLDEARQLLQDALGLADLPPDVAAQIEHARGQLLWAAGDMAASLAAYLRADELLSVTSDARLRSAVSAAMAQGLMATGQAREAERTARFAAAQAAIAGAERERVHAEITAAVARAQLGDVDAAVTGLRRSLPDARRLDDIELVLRCYGNLTFAFGIACRYEELAAAAAEGVEVCRRYGPVVSLASTLMNNYVESLITLGRWDEAVQIADEALSDITASGVALHLQTLLAEVAVARGDMAGADAQLVKVRELGSDSPYALSAVSVVMAERALWEHDPEAAAASIAESLPVLQAQDDALPLLDACWLGLRAAADIAEREVPKRRSSAAIEGRRDDLLEIARSASERTTLPVASALVLACQAEADRVDGEDTVEQWTEAADANGALKRPYDRAYCLMRLGAAQLRRQARSAAEHALSEALRTAETLGARPLVAEIQTLVTIGGLDVEPVTQPHVPTQRSDANAYGLTPREREILGFLTTGATNRVIARRLFISERTVSVHVSNILGKLGAANRTEAARVALRLHLDTGAS